VFYLQICWGENEYGLRVQGHAGLIMDNLIAEGKSRQFFIVTMYGMTNRICMGRMREFEISHFEKVLVDEFVPYIDSNFHDAEKRMRKRPREPGVDASRKADVLVPVTDGTV